MKWKRHRKFVGPSFNYNVVLSYLPVFNRNSKKLTKIIKQHIGKGPFNIRLSLKEIALNSFLEATLGLDISDSDKKLYGEYITMLVKLNLCYRVSQFSEGIRGHLSITYRLGRGDVSPNINVCYMEEGYKACVT